MQRITLLCVGPLKEKFFAQGVAEYEKRMSTLCRFTPRELPVSPVRDKNASDAEIAKALEKEGETILKAIPSGASVAALCVDGKAYSSEDVAGYLANSAQKDSGGVCFIIGSSHGLSPQVVRRAGLKISLSRMTLPHQMARLVLTEQIYRGLMINAGRQYHK